MVREKVLFLLLVCLFSHWVEPGLCAGPVCPPGKQFLWYFPEEKLDEKTHKGFSQDLFSALSGPLSEMGYWLTPFTVNDTAMRSPVYGESLLMSLYLRDANDDQIGNGEKDLFVALTEMKAWNATQGDSSQFRTLFSLRFSPKDLNAIQTIFVKKLVENFRTQYICAITITTDPKGAAVSAQNGLSDHAPFEWVLPVGTLKITCNARDYLPLEKNLVFSNPGSYNYFFQLRKRQFFHSRYIYPAAVTGLLSGVAFIYKNYYWDRYSRLGDIDRRTNPDLFGQTFSKVQFCERLSLGSILLSGAFLALSFRF
jgi:hypothetical protein